MALPPFQQVHRTRVVQLVSTAPGAPPTTGFSAGFRAPSAAVEVPVTGPVGSGARAVAGFTAHGLRLAGWYDGTRTGLDVTTPEGGTDSHTSRRHGKVPPGEVTAIATTLTGRQVTFLTQGPDGWTARATVTLDEPIDPASLVCFHEWQGESESALGAARTGPFGQLGLRDLHLVTHADGSPYEQDGLVFLTATHAGPGFFDTAHCGVWSFDRATFSLEHRGDLWFRREGRDGQVVYGDHATHLVRHDDRWLVASSTWGDFDGSAVALTLTETREDLLHGDHVLDTTVLPLPTEHGLPQPVVGVWDPHLSLIEDRWHLAFVAARRFFNFYPVLARSAAPVSSQDRESGDWEPSDWESSDWEILGAATSRKATEGTSIVRLEDQWRVVASDGRDNRPEHRAAYPVFDLGMEQVGALDAAYLSNIPWPCLVPDQDRWLLLTFDGTPHGGPLTGYGTHGDVVVMATPEQS